MPEQHPLWEFVRLSALLLAMLFGVYMLLGLAAERLAERLPPRFEAALGAAFAGQLDDTGFPRTRRYLRQVLDQLAAGSALPALRWQISVQDSPDINAAALPGGHIVVFTGLLAAVRSENELAMVLAHELGHYARRDHLRALGRGLVLLSLTAAIGMSGELPGFIAPSLQTFNLSYSREQEAAADTFAVDLLARTYGHAGGALDLFRLLARQEKQGRAAALFATHPDTAWRLQTASSHIRRNRYAQGALRPLPGTGRLPFSDDAR